MTALRVFRTNRPTLRFGPVLPMSKTDADFWRLLAARRNKSQQQGVIK